jgi:hypothetical protein
MDTIKIISQMKQGDKQPYHRSGFSIYYPNDICKWVADGIVSSDSGINYESDKSNLTNFKLEIVYDL